MKNVTLILFPTPSPKSRAHLLEKEVCVRMKYYCEENYFT